MDWITIISIVIAPILAFLLWTVYGFIKYKRNEGEAKKIIYQCIAKGMSLEKAILLTFSNLNESHKLSLSQNTINRVANKISELTTKMDLDNAIEIFTTFLHRYLFEVDSLKTSAGISDAQVLYAIESMEFNERNGYFVLKPDHGEKDDPKYPHGN